MTLWKYHKKTKTPHFHCDFCLGWPPTIENHLVAIINTAFSVFFLSAKQHACPHTCGLRLMLDIRTASVPQQFLNSFLDALISQRFDQKRAKHGGNSSCACLHMWPPQRWAEMSPGFLSAKPEAPVRCKLSQIRLEAFPWFLTIHCTERLEMRAHYHYQLVFIKLTLISPWTKFFAVPFRAT